MNVHLIYVYWKDPRDSLSSKANQVQAFANQTNTLGWIIDGKQHIKSQAKAPAQILDPLPLQQTHSHRRCFGRGAHASWWYSNDLKFDARDSLQQCLSMLVIFELKHQTVLAATTFTTMNLSNDNMKNWPTYTKCQQWPVMFSSCLFWLHFWSKTACESIGSSDWVNLVDGRNWLEKLADCTKNFKQLTTVNNK